MSKIERAIISVTNKEGIVDFATRLVAMGVRVISTGGTAKLLQQAGVPVQEISDFTGFPEMLDGRVKTLHPRVHGGILHIRSNPGHRQAIAAQGIEPIDMVVVNLYEFEKAASRAGARGEDLIENIDIGGPAMIRSAAKNFQDVAVVTAPAQYLQIAAEMESHDGSLSHATHWMLAQQAFAATAAYDSMIASALERVRSQDDELVMPTGDGFPRSLRLRWEKLLDLRYGENPHQRAALYGDGHGRGIAYGEALQGKELSYNNIVDLDAAWELAREFDEPACIIVKHTNPCGAATAGTIAEAYRKALECDPVSAFGGVIGVNREIPEDAAEEMAKLFLEAVAAPGFDPGALTRFAAKKNLRLVKVTAAPPGLSLKHVSGGLLVQDPDIGSLQPAEFKVVTRRAPSAAEMRALQFAWKVAKHVKSNAIVYAREGQTVGVGAGQMSRVDSCRIGASKAVLPLQGTVCASDAFFPFADGVREVAKAGATAVIQPGGSVRDPEVIAAADDLGLAMVFTGVRHFRH